jgi:hypothetical protein
MLTVGLRMPRAFASPIMSVAALNTDAEGALPLRHHVPGAGAGAVDGGYYGSTGFSRDARRSSGARKK